MFTRCAEIAQWNMITYPDHNRYNHQIQASNTMYAFLRHSKNIRPEIIQKLLLDTLTHDIGHAFPTSHGVESYREAFTCPLPLWNLNHEAIGEYIRAIVYKDCDVPTNVVKAIPITMEEEICNSLVASHVDVDRISYLIEDTKMLSRYYGQVLNCPFTLDTALANFDCEMGFTMDFTKQLIDYRAKMITEVYLPSKPLILAPYHYKLRAAHISIEAFTTHWAKLSELPIGPWFNEDV